MSDELQRLAVAIAHQEDEKTILRAERDMARERLVVVSKTLDDERSDHIATRNLLKNERDHWKKCCDDEHAGRFQALIDVGKLNTRLRELQADRLMQVKADGTFSPVYPAETAEYWLNEANRVERELNQLKAKIAQAIA